MKDILVIVDSPEKGKVLGDYFAGSAEILMCFSPVLRASHRTETSGQQVNLVYNFEPLPSGTEVIGKLDSFTGENIYVAFDDDPRSDYLGWTISSYLQQKKIGKGPAKRLRLAGLRSEEISEAVKFAALVEDAQGVPFYTRSFFDSCLSRHLNRLIGTSKGPGNLPLNFNSLSTLFLLADREMEINMFATTMKWQVKAELKHGGEAFWARLEEAYDSTSDGFVKDAEEAKKLVSRVQEDKFKVDQVEKEDLVIEPPLPYQLVELLQEALLLEISPKDLLGIVRKLYHGVDIQGVTKGLVSSFYSLTNANVSDWLLQLKKQATKAYGERVLGERSFEPEDGMIFPLHPELTGESLKGVLSDNEVQIYELIRTKAIASQMKEAFGENIRLEISAGPESIFSAHINSVSSQGFLAAFNFRYDFVFPSPFGELKQGDDLNLSQLVPEQTTGVNAEYYMFETLFTDLMDFSIAVDPLNIIMLQGMMNSGYINTSNDGGLMAGDSVSQVLAIINKAFPRMQGINLSAYIEQTIAEALTGRKGLDFALKQFDQTLMLHGNALVKPKPKVPPKLKPRHKRPASSVIKTAVEPPAGQVPAPAPPKEQDAPIVDPAVPDEKVAALEQAPEQALKEVDAVDTPTEQDTSAVEDVMDDSAQQEEVPQDEAAAEDEAVEAVVDQDSVLESEEEFAVPELMGEEAFLAEEEDEWPDELKSVFEQALKGAAGEVGTQDQAAPAPIAPGTDEIVETGQEKQCQVCGKAMQLKKDRFGKFWSCSGFPGCRHSETFDSKGGDAMACPVCSDGKIVNKRTPSGKTFYVCLEPECEFMAWSRPHYVSCQVCDFPYLIEKKTLKGKIQLKCPKAGCNYGQNLKGGVVAPAAEGDAAPKKKRRVRIRRVPKGTAAKSSGGGGKKKVRMVRRKK